MMLTFVLVCIAWIFFRAPDAAQAFHYIARMFSAGWGGIAVERRLWLFIGVMLSVEWLNRDREHGLAMDRVSSRSLRWAIYVCLAVVIFFFGAPPQAFIYFQF